MPGCVHPSPVQNGTQACSASRDGIASQVREVIYNRGGTAFLSLNILPIFTSQHNQVTILWLLSAYRCLIQVFRIYGVSLLCVWTLYNSKLSGVLTIRSLLRFSCMKYGILRIAFSLHLHQQLLSVEFLTIAILPSVR